MGTVVASPRRGALDREVALSDGVFAILIAILVLEPAVPISGDAIVPNPATETDDAT